MWAAARAATLSLLGHQQPGVRSHGYRLCAISVRLDCLGGRFVVIWVAIAFSPARVARRKGHSFIGYFIFSLFLFPLALITAYLVHDRRAPAY
jgi:hypothetical protein